MLKFVRGHHDHNPYFRRISGNADLPSEFSWRHADPPKRPTVTLSNDRRLQWQRKNLASYEKAPSHNGKNSKEFGNP
ncbi:hypothetical protein G9A89_005035 [Geosiphon pyriformis]|nr:hypothetical protein G9A89_005035 [Geosiphon pyriformis]